MKYISVLVIILLLTGCQPYYAENRFDGAGEYLNGDTMKYIIDKKTGCKYILFSKGIAPLYKNSKEVDCNEENIK